MNRSREYARGLLDKARDDAFVLTRLADDPKAAAWILGFHAQQSVEKALKAVLAARSIEYPRTHNLTMLLALIQEHGISPPPPHELLGVLTPYGVVFRYDLQEEDVQSLDLAAIKTLLFQILDWAKNEVESSH